MRAALNTARNPVMVFDYKGYEISCSTGYYGWDHGIAVFRPGEGDCLFVAKHTDADGIRQCMNWINQQKRGGD